MNHIDANPLHNYKLSILFQINIASLDCFWVSTIDDWMSSLFKDPLWSKEDLLCFKEHIVHTVPNDTSATLYLKSTVIHNECSIKHLMLSIWLLEVEKYKFKALNICHEGMN